MSVPNSSRCRCQMVVKQLPPPVRLMKSSKSKSPNSAKIVLCVLSIVCSFCVIVWKVTKNRPIKMISAHEMAVLVPDFDYSVHHIPAEESPKRIIELASSDAGSNGYPCFFQHSFFCEQSKFYIYVFMLETPTDTHLLYRVDASNSIILDKAVWGIYQMFNPEIVRRSKNRPK
jgi:hypothetical protein